MSETSHPTHPSAATTEIVVVGSTIMDLTSYLPHEIAEGETVIATGFEVGLGGKGANQAVAAARAGGRVGFIGRVGKDAFGERILAGLGNESIELSHLEQAPGDTANATIWVQENGANRIAVYLGASADIDPASVAESVDSYPNAQFLVTQLELKQAVGLAGLKAAKARGMTTVLNIAPYADLHPETLPHTDWLIANEVELQALLASIGVDASLEAPTDGLLAELPGWVSSLGVNLIVTLGSEGAIGATHDEDPVFVAAPKVDAMDTVGAGDCFVGFFVAAMAQGRSWPEAMGSGVRAASESVTRPGAQASYPAAEDAQRIHAG